MCANEYVYLGKLCAQMNHILSKMCANVLPPLSMFWSKNKKKKMCIPCIPSLAILKWGLMGVYITRNCYLDDFKVNGLTICLLKTVCGPYFNDFTNIYTGKHAFVFSSQF